MPNIWQQTENTYDPFTSYLESLGLGTKSYYTPGENYLINLYNPLSLMQGLQGRMATSPSFSGWTPAAYLSEYAQPFVQNPRSIYSRAYGLLQALSNASPESLAEAGATYEPTFTGAGERESSGNIDELQDLLRLGLREKFGISGANWAAQRLPGIQQQWVNRQAAGGTGMFWDYLKTKYNL